MGTLNEKKTINCDSILKRQAKFIWGFIHFVYLLRGQKPHGEKPQKQKPQEIKAPKTQVRLG